MTVYLVGAGPGDPWLLTRRGELLLKEADVVLYDRLVHYSVLDLAPPSAELIDVGKRPDGSQRGPAQQEEINRLLLEHGRKSPTVVRLKGGDPFLFGRGGEEAEVLERAGVPWEVVPGITSAFGVPAAAGIPVTHRGLSSLVTVVTGHGDDPDAPGAVDWEMLARLNGTLVILMGMLNREAIADALQRGGKAATTPVAIIYHGTTSDEVAVRTTLGQMADVALGSPSVIVIGPVAALVRSTSLPDRVGQRGPLTGRTVVVTRAGSRAASLVEALHRAGAETLELPLTEQSEPSDGGAALTEAADQVSRGHYAWVIFTSVNAVMRFMALLRDARSMAGTLVAAVGPGTADALRQAGVEPDLIPVVHRAEGLIAEFPHHRRDVSKARVLFPCGDRTPSTIVDALAGKGWQVDRVLAYRTVALAPPVRSVLDRLKRADAVTFTAASSVEAYAGFRAADGRALPVAPLVICIGPTTAARARSLGLAHVEEAHDATAQGIVDALVDHLAWAGPLGS